MNVSPLQNTFAALAFAAVMLAGTSAVAQDAAAPHAPAAHAQPHAAAAPADAAKKDIVDTAVAAGDFKTLVAAVKAADLAATLKGEGPFTVFAPTDEAFAKLPKEALADLLKPENKEKLASILTYHVVPGKVDAAAVSKMTSAKTVNGKDVTVKAENGTVMINDAKVIKADIPASNGIIHVVDTVLMPK